MRKSILYTLAGACAAVLVTTTSALAGSGVGGVFNLGQVNTVNGTSTLTGSTSAPRLKVLNSSAANHGLLAQSAGGNGIALYGQHTSTAGAGPALRGDSASTAASAFSVYGLLGSTAAGANSAALRGENKATSANGSGVWGSHAGSGNGVYGSSTSGIGVYGLGGIGIKGLGTSGDGVYGQSSNGFGVDGVSSGNVGVRGLNTGGTFQNWGVYGSGQSPTGIGVRGSGNGAGVEGSSSAGVGVRGTSTSNDGVYGQSSTAHGVTGIAHSAGGTGVFGENDTTTGFGVRGTNDVGVGVRGESSSFQGVSGYSTHNAGVFGMTQDGFAAYFVGPTEQHGALNVYDSTASVANGSVRIARGTASFSGTGAALQAEHAGTNGEAAWFRIGNAANTNSVLMLVRPAGSGDSLRCYQQGANEGQKCHIDANGTFQSGSDFAESLPARGAKARYGPGDVLSISGTEAGQVVKSDHARDRALIGVYRLGRAFWGRTLATGSPAWERTRSRLRSPESSR